MRWRKTVTLASIAISLHKLIASHLVRHFAVHPYLSAAADFHRLQLEYVQPGQVYCQRSEPNETDGYFVLSANGSTIFIVTVFPSVCPRPNCEWVASVASFSFRLPRCDWDIWTRNSHTSFDWNGHKCVYWCWHRHSLHVRHGFADERSENPFCD